MNGVDTIAAERARQVAEEGWTPEHDDAHRDHELALAAACYAAPDLIYIGNAHRYGVALREAWPWDRDADKRDGDLRMYFPASLALVVVRNRELREQRIRELAKAGALLAAEIDRLRRVGS